MKLINTIRILAVAAVMGVLAGASLTIKAQAVDSDQINKLFTQMKLHAVNAENDAELLESYTRSGLHWRSHSDRVHSMREHVNNLVDDYNQAKNLRDKGSDWQKNAVDQIEPLVQGMADHLSATIKHLNNNQNKTKMQAWQDYVKANREYASKAANLIRDYVEYSEAKAKADSLESHLQLPGNPGEE